MPVEEKATAVGVAAANLPEPSAQTAAPAAVPWAGESEQVEQVPSGEREPIVERIPQPSPPESSPLEELGLLFFFVWNQPENFRLRILF